MFRRFLGFALPFVATVGTVDCTSQATGPSPSNTPCTQTACVYWSSFEGGMEGWLGRAADAGPWEVTRTSTRVRDGAWSLRLYADNTTDFTKLWLQRSFFGKPQQAYEVTTEFGICCIDYDPASPNRFSVIADTRPTSPDELMARDLTLHAPDAGDDSSAASIGNALWRHKRFVRTVQASGAGEIVVFVGVRLGFEIPFTFYVDNVRVTIKELLAP